jgi:hypothetical protein
MSFSAKLRFSRTLYKYRQLAKVQRLWTARQGQDADDSEAVALGQVVEFETVRPLPARDDVIPVLKVSGDEVKKQLGNKVEVEDLVELRTFY